MNAKCKGCNVELSFEPKSETIAYYCSLKCYHGGQATPRGAVVMDPYLAEALRRYHLAIAHLEGTERGLVFRSLEGGAAHARRCWGKCYAPVDLLIDSLHGRGWDPDQLRSDARDKLDEATDALLRLCEALELP